MPFLLVGIRLRAADIGIMLPLRVGCLLHLDLGICSWAAAYPAASSSADSSIRRYLTLELAPLSFQPSGAFFERAAVLR